ncbi:LOW QUALITY PROTEIN: hypothetical protein CFOL_v3_17767, partial [Cephalotus follicularis]
MGNVRISSQGSFVVGHRAGFGRAALSDQGPGHKGPGIILVRRTPESPPRRFPSLKTMLLTKCPSLSWGKTAMS